MENMTFFDMVKLLNKEPDMQEDSVNLKILKPKTLLRELDDMVNHDNITYMEALKEYCLKNEIDDYESIGLIIRNSKALMERFTLDAMSNRTIKATTKKKKSKSAKLPI